MLRYGVRQGSFGKLKRIKVTTEDYEDAELWGPDFMLRQNSLDEGVDEDFWPVWPV
jgi:hypothetical protein